MQVLLNTPEEILHIGDKLDADFDSPKALGMKSIHYSVIPHTMSEICDYEKICFNEPKYLTSLRKLAVHSCSDSSKTENQIGAGVLGLAFTLFCDWAIDICEREGKKNIYPFMREAEVFAPMLENAIEKRGLSINVKPLYVSRQATWLSSISFWDEEECDNLLDKYGFTVGDAFQSIGLSFPCFLRKEIIDSKIKSLDKQFLNQIRSFLTSEEVVWEVNQEIRKRSKLLFSYLKQEANLLENSVTVDLGFRGTINSNIENTLAKHGTSSSCTHLLAFGSNSLLQLKDRGIDVRGFFSSPGLKQEERKIIHRSLMPLEQLILGELGSTIGFDYNNGKVEPCFDNTRVPRTEFKTKRFVRESIIKFQDLWYETFGNKEKTIDENKHEIQKNIALQGVIRLINCPTPKEAKLLGNLHHEVNGGSTQIRRICSRDDLAVLKKAQTADYFMKLGRINGVHWPQGVLTYTKPYYLIKKQLDRNTSDSYLQTMNDVIESAQIDKFSKIIIYGAGEVGKAAVKAAKINSLKVACFVDRKKSHWGTYIEEIQVFSLEKALDIYPKVPLLIGSFEFLDQIESTIKDMLAKKELTNQILSTKDLCL